MKKNDKDKGQLLSNLSAPISKIVKSKSKDSDRKQPVEKTKKTRGFLDNIIESSLDGIIATDDQGCIARANQAFLKLIGYKEGEVTGKHITEFSIREIGVYELTAGNKIKITQDYFDKQEAMIAHLLEGREARNRNSYFIRKDGKVVPCEQNISALYDEEGKVNGAVGIIRDITERTKSERKVKEIRDLLNDIFTTAADGIMVTDSSGFIIMVNDAFETISGYPKEDLIGKHAKELRAKGIEHEEKGIEFAEKLLRDGSAVGSNIPWLRKDGSLVYIERSAALLRDKDGTLSGAVSTIRDITEKKKAEDALRETKDHLDNIIESSLDSIVLTDDRGYVTNTNTSFLELLGYTNENQVIGKHMAEFSPIEAGTYDSVTGQSVHIDKEFLDSILSVMATLSNKGKISNLEFYLIRTDKKILSVEENIVNLYNKKGERTGTVGVIRNITERKNYEEALKKSEEKYQHLIENANDAVISINREGMIVTLNKKVEEMYGYTREELLGKSVLLLVPPHRREAQKKSLENLKTIPKIKGFSRTLETTACGKDGKEFPVETSMFSSEIHGEYILTSFVRDITERKNAESKLKQTNDFLERLIENSKDGILVVDAMGNILSCNTAIEQMSGFGKEKIIGEHASTLIIDDKQVRQNILEKTAELFEKGFATYDAKYKSRDGKYLDVECTSSMISNEQGEHIAGVSIIRDISERKKAECEIREGKEFLEKIIKGSKDGILIGDEKGYILSANEAMEEMLGLSKDEIVGKHSSELLLDDRSEREKVLAQMGELFENGFATYEARYKSKNSDYVEVECYLSMIKDEKGNYIAGISIVRDITERKKMQQQLLQSEKLRSLGELAGGVAHDFNNVLAAILGRAQLLKMQFKPPPGKQEKRKSMLDLIKSLEIIERASSDGAETVRRIQEFARKRSDDKDFTQVNINELLDNVLDFTSVRWKGEAEAKGTKVTIQKEFSSLPGTSGSAAELREVFTNIINNALDAMPQGGRLHIKTFKENNHISIRIKDSGVGIPEDIRNRIFDPFFTTKGVQSTGLGMSTSYGIINRHQGTIAVDSVEGVGTTFTIKLPITEGSLGKNETMATIPRGQRKARILVVDDEDEVRQLLSDILTSEEHDVDSASDGAQALELFKKNDFDMVFTDLGMPGMSGWEVAKAIKGINRKVPVAIITGWNIDMTAIEMKEKGADLIAYKPFEVNRILQLVQEGMELREQFEAA